MSPLTRLRSLAFALLLGPGLIAGHAWGDAGARYAHGLLWRVEVPGAPPSHLFGTLHSDDERVVVLPAPARRAFAGATRLAIEFLADETAAGRFRRAMLTRTPELPQALGANDYATVDLLLGEHGIARAARAYFKPWAALLTLLQPVRSTALILDNVLVHEAQRRSLPIDGLETVEEQIAAFDGMPAPSQVALLRHVAARHAEIQAAVWPTVEAYLEQDLARLWQVNQETMAADPAIAPHQAILLERVLDARSARFALRLAPLLRQGGVFAAFGALHLYGPRGVPALLEQDGLRLTPIAAAPAAGAR